MSMRPPVDRKRIVDFLEQLGRRFRKPGRVFLDVYHFDVYSVR